MTKLKAVLAAALFAVLAATAGIAAAQDLREGRDYELVSPPQPTETAGKIEVIEFFSYMCPHCAHFEPNVSKWMKSLPKDVVFRRIPVIFRPQWEAPAHLYYTLEAMGAVDKLQSAAFDAIHVEGLNLTTDAAVVDWAVKRGLDRKKVEDNYRSFTVQSKTQRARQLSGAYGIAGVPSLVVAGKYRTPENFSGDQEDLLKLVDALIVKARREAGRK
jgi:thiol:disulfide interchange protein DsbA